MARSITLGECKGSEGESRIHRSSRASSKKIAITALVGRLTIRERIGATTRTALGMAEGDTPAPMDPRSKVFGSTATSVE